MKVFANESECLVLDGLTIENRVDRVSFYGSVDFTRDQVGLKAARDLKAILDDVIEGLEAVSDLPEQIEILAAVEVDSPFK